MSAYHYTVYDSRVIQKLSKSATALLASVISAPPGTLNIAED